MRYEVRAKSIAGAVQRSLAPYQSQLERKSGTTIDADLYSYSYERVTVTVNAGSRYTISWSAGRVSSGGLYGIDIQSYDAHGSHREAFSRSGSWNFVARQSGEIEFLIGVSRTFGVAWGSYPVDISID